jgi:hypothetical protein
MMDDYFPIAIAVIFIALFVGAAITFALILRRIGKLNEVYARLADNYKGQATSGWLFIRPTLTFNREGTVVNVHTFRRGRREGEDILEIECDWPNHPFWMKLQDRRLPRYLTRWFATEEIRTGDPSFDDRFRLCGNDASLLTDALASAPKTGTTTGRVLIETLRSLQVDDLRVRVDRGQFVVCKQGAFYSYEELSELISFSLALFDHLKVSTTLPSSPPLPPRTATV